MCRDVSSTSVMRAEIEMERGHGIFVWHQRKSEMIDLGGVFNEYWGSTKQEFIVPSQSWLLTSSITSNGEAQRSLSLENIAGL